MVMINTKRKGWGQAVLTAPQVKSRPELGRDRRKVLDWRDVHFCGRRLKDMKGVTSG
jgi:hypothetical protein